MRKGWFQKLIQVYLRENLRKTLALTLKLVVYENMGIGAWTRKGELVEDKHLILHSRDNFWSWHDLHKIKSRVLDAAVSHF